MVGGGSAPFLPFAMALIILIFLQKIHHLYGASLKFLENLMVSIAALGLGDLDSNSGFLLSQIQIKNCV